jgi:hypothetical protein
MCRAVLPLPLYVFIVWCLVKHRGNQGIEHSTSPHPINYTDWIIWLPIAQIHRYPIPIAILNNNNFILDQNHIPIYILERFKILGHRLHFNMSHFFTCRMCYCPACIQFQKFPSFTTASATLTAVDILPQSSVVPICMKAYGHHCLYNFVSFTSRFKSLSSQSWHHVVLW